MHLTQTPGDTIRWLIDWLIDGHFLLFLVFFSFPKTATCLDFFPSYEVAGATWRSGLVTEPSTLLTMPLLLLSVIPKVLEPSLPLWKKTGKEREERESVRTKKINMFPLSGWAVSLACQWSRYSPCTRVRRAPSQSPLTRGKHADSNQEQVRTQICTSSARPRGWCEGPPNGEGPGSGWEGGTVQRALAGFSLSCLNVSLPLTNAFILTSIIYLWIHQRKPRCTDCGQEKFITFVVATSSRSLFRSFSFSPFSPHLQHRVPQNNKIYIYSIEYACRWSLST